MSKYIPALVTILSTMAAPFGAYALSETSLKAAVVLAVIAGLGALKNLFDTSMGPALPASAVPVDPSAPVK